MTFQRHVSVALTVFFLVVAATLVWYDKAGAWLMAVAIGGATLEALALLGVAKADKAAAEKGKG